MNDYLGTGHQAIYDMVRSGEPDQSRNWARDVAAISNKLGSQLSALAEQSAGIGSVWSDGVSSVRLTVDLAAVIGYLHVLVDGLSGHSASSANLGVQAAADLAAAQLPSALPPPPGTSAAPLVGHHRPITACGVGPEGAAAVQLELQIAAHNDARLRAGETASVLDNAYRTALARLTAPPEPPGIVLQAAASNGVEVAWTPAETTAAQSDSPGATLSASAIELTEGAVVSAAMLAGRECKPVPVGVRSAGGGTAGTAGAGTAGAGAVGTGTDGTGTASGAQPGLPGQPGQTGPTDRSMAGAPGLGLGHPGQPAVFTGGEHGCRVTWLVEDRDFYGRSPTVKSVIEASGVW